MIVCYTPNVPGPEREINLIRFTAYKLDLVSELSAALCHPTYGPSVSAWIVPGTCEDED
jgi:hypothetical protein